MLLLIIIIIIMLSLSSSSKRDKTILYSRTITLSLLFVASLAYKNFYILTLKNGIGLGLSSSVDKQKKEENFFCFKNLIINKTGEQYKILEYSLILLFIVCGATFFNFTSDHEFCYMSVIFVLNSKCGPSPKVIRYKFLISEGFSHDVARLVYYKRFTTSFPTYGDILDRITKLLEINDSAVLQKDALKLKEKMNCGKKTILDEIHSRYALELEGQKSIEDFFKKYINEKNKDSQTVK